MTVKRFAILDGANVIGATLWDPVADPDYEFPEPHTQLLEHATAEVGWVLGENGFLVNPSPSPAPENIPFVPADYQLTRRQIRGALIDAGILDPDAWMAGVMAAIEDPAARAHALNDWQNASTYNRDNPLFNDPALLAAAQLSPPAIDALWMAAKDLPA